MDELCHPKTPTYGLNCGVTVETIIKGGAKIVCVKIVI